MNKAEALLLLESLIDRLVKDPRTGKWKLEGIISNSEREALLFVFQQVGGNIGIVENGDTEQPYQKMEKRNEQISLNLESIHKKNPDVPDDEKLILCLDFGTAMSKACATYENDLNIYALGIGDYAGQVSPKYALKSSIYITSEGTILFGERAISETGYGDYENHRRLDSFKDIFSKGEIRNLEEAMLEKIINPTAVPLSEADILTLYLGYFTDMALSELNENEEFNMSRFVGRRFTLPFFDSDNNRSQWAREQLEKCLIRAQIVADTLHGQWEDGLDIHVARSLLDQIKQLDKLPAYIIRGYIAEPIAAVASRYRHSEHSTQQRKLYMLVDVGAGTIDFALFATEVDNGEIKIVIVPKSVRVLRQAGDQVDKLLRNFILKDANLTAHDKDFAKAAAVLDRDVRIMKEALFVEERLPYKLSNDDTGNVLLNDFLRDESAQVYEKKIHEVFDDILFSIDESWLTNCAMGELPIVYTGGGAKLPMIRSLGDRTITVNGTVLSCRNAELLPGWIKTDFPNISDEFPQLAVVIGGASRDIPKLVDYDGVNFYGDGGGGPWNIPPSYKGS